MNSKLADHQKKVFSQLKGLEFKLPNDTPPNYSHSVNNPEPKPNPLAPTIPGNPEKTHQEIERKNRQAQQREQKRIANEKRKSEELKWIEEIQQKNRINRQKQKQELQKYQNKMKEQEENKFTSKFRKNQREQRRKLWGKNSNDGEGDIQIEPYRFGNSATLSGWKKRPQFNVVQKSKGLKTRQALEADRFVDQQNVEMHGNSKQEILSSISQKILSPQKIEEQVSKMKKMLFYQPTTGFYNAIKQTFTQAPVDEVLYSAVVFRKQHLLAMDSNQKNIQQLYKYVRAWGKYLFDLKDLQKYATQKRGNAITGIYQLKAWNLEVVVSQNDINVKYNGRVLQPQEFQWVYLRPRAIQRLKDHAKQVYVKFMKNKIQV